MELAESFQAQRLESPMSLRDLADLARNEEARNDDHHDIVLRNTEVLSDGAWRFNGSSAPLSRHALRQLCGRLVLPDGSRVPANYLANCPSLLRADHLNHWLQTCVDTDRPVFVRTRTRRGRSEPYVRAVLSPRYAVVRHQRLLETLEELAPRHDLDVQSYSLDDEQMTLRLNVRGEHPATLDDPLRIGIAVSNSEVGLGRVTVSGLITRLVCSNGLIVNVADLGIIRRRHIGKASESLDDVIQAGLPRVLDAADIACRRFVALRGQAPPMPMDKFLAQIARQADLPEAVLTRARHHLDDESVYGVVNAFTRAAQDFPVAERVAIEVAMSQFLGEDRPWT